MEETLDEVAYKNGIEKEGLIDFLLIHDKKKLTEGEKEVVEDFIVSLYMKFLKEESTRPELMATKLRSMEIYIQKINNQLMTEKNDSNNNIHIQLNSIYGLNAADISQLLNDIIKLNDFKYLDSFFLI